MEKKTNYMKISELSKRSGVPIQKIKQYIDQGLLLKPIKAGKTLAYYTSQHIDRLKIIKEMDKEELPVTILKSLISSAKEIKEDKKKGKTNFPQITKKQVLLFKKIINSVADVEGRFKKENVDLTQVARTRIIEASIPIFRKKGYEKTTIADIAKTAGIARNTLYQHFKNKKELFIVCVDTIFFNIKKESEDNKDFWAKTKKRGQAFYNSYPQWSDMMNHLRAMAVKEPDDFADILEEALSVRINTVIEDFKEASTQGLIREIDIEIFAIGLAGAIDYLSYYLYRGRFGQRKFDEVSKTFFDFWYNGLKIRK